MILIIIIILSNGGSMRYEINNNFFCEQFSSFDENGKHLSFERVIEFNSLRIINYENGKKSESIFDVNNSSLWDVEKFKKSTTIIDIDGRESLFFSHDILKNHKHVQYYIQVKELDKLNVRKNIIPFVDGNYVFSNTELCSIDEECTKPIKVNTNWVVNFSEDFLKIINQFPIQKP